ncbi:MAG: hypothetical protein AAB728_00095 [Patescibacteria group bacterium]
MRPMVKNWMRMKNAASSPVSRPSPVRMEAPVVMAVPVPRYQ